MSFCIAGYSIAGGNTVQCLGNSQWSPVSFSCRIVTCGRPPGLEHSYTAGMISPLLHNGIFPYNLTLLGFQQQ